ncbi:hypothetical protein M0802_002742 [Mischocyttarus mexicanus]|nr:hypothetical protein M0802_002742 [Mischocyttarus mexicanus]
MILLSNILKTRWMKSSQISVPKYRFFFTSTYFASTMIKNTKSFQKFKLKQARMQRNDGVPIYLKAGLRDKILFNLTLGLSLFGVIDSIQTIRELIKNT